MNSYLFSEVLDRSCMDIVEKSVDRDVPPQGILQWSPKFLQ